MWNLWNSLFPARTSAPFTFELPLWYWGLLLLSLVALLTTWGRFWFALRNLRAYWMGARDGKRLASKHASLAYLTPNAFPLQLKARIERACRANLYTYERKRGRLENRLRAVIQRRIQLERDIPSLRRSTEGTEESSIKAHAHTGRWTWIGRYLLLAAVFAAEVVYNKLATDALGVNQLEAYVVAFVASAAMFWMGHKAGHLFSKRNYLLSGVTLGIALLLAVFMALLRAAFTREQVAILGLNLPTHLALPTLLVLGIALVAFTFFLGQESLTENEIVFRQHRNLEEAETRLKQALETLQRVYEKRLEWLHAHYREEVAAYWRGFARAWPAWDPSPEFVGHVLPLECPLRPLEGEVSRENRPSAPSA
jgi:hypothetical protein